MAPTQVYEMVRESSGEGGGSHHKSSLSSSLVLQRRCTLTIGLFQLLACRSISLLDDNLALAIRPSVVLPQDRQILPVIPLRQTLLGCKHPKLRQFCLQAPPSPPPALPPFPLPLSVVPSLTSLLPLPLPSQGGSIIL